jgi:signal transduction histidine kinase
LWNGVILLVALGAFGGMTIAIHELEEQNEPAIVAALEPPDAESRRLFIALAVALPLTALTSLVASRALTRRALAPLDRIVATAAEVGDGRLEARVAVDGKTPAEVARLSAALNQMLDRLERSHTAMRRFTEDAAHELRTPLAAARAELELALAANDAAQAAGALEKLGDLSRLVDDLLNLALADHEALPLNLAPVDLRDIVNDVIALHQPAFDERGQTLRTELAPTPLVADAAWLRRAISNLVDNARRYTPSGGQIDLRLADNRLEVLDSGPGIPADEREAIFTRFSRGTLGRTTNPSGAGLGLTLAREIARLHGGDLTVEPSDRGARFVLKTTGRS